MSESGEGNGPIEGVVFDATVLSNYAASNSVEFLVSTFSEPRTTTAVKDEVL